MAGKSLSVRKRARQSEKRRFRNRQQKRKLKEAVKSIRAEADKTKAMGMMPGSQSVIDKSARKHIIHRNAARRLKARLAREIAEKG